MMILNWHQCQTNLKVSSLTMPNWMNSISELDQCYAKFNTGFYAYLTYRTDGNFDGSCMEE